jgi:3-oxoacyl-[acyl-carrier protein] reductase
MSERKVAIVAGSATGVGAATALLLARRGYNVLINYSKSVAEAQESQAACQRAGADTRLVQGDVAVDADWDALDAQTFQPILGVNTVGAFQMVRACVPHLKAGGKGAIVNVSSIAGALGMAHRCPTSHPRVRSMP